MEWQINTLCFCISPELCSALVHDWAYVKVPVLEYWEEYWRSRCNLIWVKAGDHWQEFVNYTYMISSDYKEFDRGHIYTPTAHIKSDVCQGWWLKNGGNIF